MTNAPPADPTILLTRIFEAPREAVFAAWLDPDQVAKWYGPEHFTTPREKITIEPRVGGRWDVTMVQLDDGREFPASYEIVELVEPELIVLRGTPMPEYGIPEGTVTRVELHDHGEKTRMTLSDGPYDDAMSANAEAGWNGAFDKLGALLGRMTDETATGSRLPQARID